MRQSEVERLFGNPAVLLGFMRRTRKPVFHNSNIFYRDIEYAIKDYFDAVERKPISLTVAARMANEVIELYTDVGILRKVANQAYLLESAEWTTPPGGTYTMLTIHGAPIPDPLEQVLELAIAETPGEQALRQQEAVKGGDVSPQGATIAALQVAALQHDTTTDVSTEPARESANEKAAPAAAPPWLRKAGT